jgi:hypothetical protein
LENQHDSGISKNADRANARAMGIVMVKIFVGCPANNEDLECQAVLDYSLRMHASEELEITWMMLSRDPESFWYSDPQRGKGWNTQTWATPFSALRWGIPAVCNYEGLAIYMDCDMIAMADIAELKNQTIPSNKALLAKHDGPNVIAPCVMLMDCERMQGVLPPIESLKKIPGHYRTVRHKIEEAAGDYEGDWNCRDGERCSSIHEPHVKIVHYTNIPTQPNHLYARQRLAREGRKHWYSGHDQTHPRADIQRLFDETFKQASMCGRGPETFRVSPEFGEYGR